MLHFQFRMTWGFWRNSSKQTCLKKEPQNGPRGHDDVANVVCFTAGYSMLPFSKLEGWLIQKYFQNMKLNLILIRFNHYDDNDNNSWVLVDPLGPSSLRSNHFDLNKNPPWSSAFRCRNGWGLCLVLHPTSLWANGPACPAGYEMSEGEPPWFCIYTRSLHTTELIYFYQILLYYIEYSGSYYSVLLGYEKIPLF